MEKGSVIYDTNQGNPKLKVAHLGIGCKVNNDCDPNPEPEPDNCYCLQITLKRLIYGGRELNLNELVNPQLLDSLFKRTYVDIRDCESGELLYGGVNIGDFITIENGLYRFNTTICKCVNSSSKLDWRVIHRKSGTNTDVTVSIGSKTIGGIDGNQLILDQSGNEIPGQTFISNGSFNIPWGNIGNERDVIVGQKNGPGDNIITGEYTLIQLGFSVKSEECKTDVDCCVNECIKLTMPLDTDNIQNIITVLEKNPITFKHCCDGQERRYNFNNFQYPLTSPVTFDLKGKLIIDCMKCEWYS